MDVLDDTLEEDIEDFSVCQERMKMQSQIKIQFEKETKLNIRQKMFAHNIGPLTLVENTEEDMINDENDDLNTSEHPDCSLS